jgi:16S rRNA U516 pseudouridylate synthase RsuA-like enzyme
MCESVGHEVVRLMRVSFAGLTLGNLAVGQWRFLKKDEIRKIKRLAGMT